MKKEGESLISVNLLSNGKGISTVMRRRDMLEDFLIFKRELKMFQKRGVLTRKRQKKKNSWGLRLSKNLCKLAEEFPIV